VQSSHVSRRSGWLHQRARCDGRSVSVMLLVLLSVVLLASANAGASDEAVRERRVTTQIDWRAC